MITGTPTAARNLRAARARLAEATEIAQVQAIAEYDAGTPETEIAKALGVSRMTVRRWLGKAATAPAGGPHAPGTAPPRPSTSMPPPA